MGARRRRGSRRRWRRPSLPRLDEPAGERRPGSVVAAGGARDALDHADVDPAPGRPGFGLLEPEADVEEVARGLVDPPGCRWSGECQVRKVANVILQSGAAADRRVAGPVSRVAGVLLFVPAFVRLAVGLAWFAAGVSLTWHQLQIAVGLGLTGAEMGVVGLMLLRPYALRRVPYPLFPVVALAIAAQSVLALVAVRDRNAWFNVIFALVFGAVLCVLPRRWPFRTARRARLDRRDRSMKTGPCGGEEESGGAASGAGLVIDVVTHRMPSLASVAKEIAFTVAYEELLDEVARQRLALTLANDEGAWRGLNPGRLALRQLAQEALSDAADAVRDPFGPGSRYRVVIEILAGEPHGEPMMYCSMRTEIIVD
jgi:hypothetical protein